MKKAFKIFALINVILLYGFAISINSSNPSNASVSFSTATNSQHESYHPDVTPGLFCHTIQEGNSFTGYSHVPSSCFKNSSNTFSACANAAEQLFSGKFSQYIFYSKNILIRLKQTDFIYPFHHFW